VVKPALIGRLWIGPLTKASLTVAGCPKGRKAEDGPIDAKCQLQETLSSNYLQRTEWNVRDSGGTVIFGLAQHLDWRLIEDRGIVAMKHRKPHLHLSASKNNAATELKKHGCMRTISVC